MRLLMENIAVCMVCRVCERVDLVDRDGWSLL